jgi:hypothetical protein
MVIRPSLNLKNYRYTIAFIVLVESVKLLTVPNPKVIAVNVWSRIFQKIKLTVNIKYIILIYDVYNCVSEGVDAWCCVL